MNRIIQIMRGPRVICARPGVRLAAAGAAVTNLRVHIIKIGIIDPYLMY